MKPANPKSMKSDGALGQRPKESTTTAIRTWRIAAMIATVAAVMFISVMPQVTNDFWLQAKIGELIVQEGKIPNTVLFPFTPIQNATFNAHEWLPSILFHWFIDAFGEMALPLILGLLCLILFAVVLKLTLLKSGGHLPWALLLGLLAVAVENQRNFLRPELLSLIELAIYWYLLERMRRRASWMDAGLALAVVILWANTHGSFVLAPIIAGIYATGTLIDRLRGSPVGTVDPSAATAKQYAVFAVAALLCTMVTPFGWDMLKFAVGFSQAAIAKRSIIEWLPTMDPRFLTSRGWWIGIGAMAITAIVVMKRWRDLGAVELLTFVFFTLLAFKAIRFLVYVGLAAAFTVAPLVPKRWGPDKGQMPAYASSALLSIVVLVLAMLFGNVFGAYPHYSPATQSFTQPMIRALKAPELKGNVLTSYDMGAELTYRAYPRLRPSIDSRIDSYGDDYHAFHMQLMQDDALLSKFVREYEVNYMLLNYSDLRLLMKLPNWTQGRWEVRFRDQRAVLLQRKET